MLLRIFLPWLRAGLGVFALGALAMTAAMLHRPPAAAPATAAAALPLPLPRQVDLPAGDVFARPSLAHFERELQRYRLSGTFMTFDFGQPDAVVRPQTQLALIDDLQQGQQRIVRAGERLGPFEITGIEANQVRVRREDQEWVLQLAGVFAAGPQIAGGTPAAAGEAPMTWDDMPVIEHSAWGKRVAENQWLIERAAIFDFAEQMMADPRRAIALYQSFTAAPPGGEEQWAGFELNMAGEREFFTAMGLEDGDVIRRVNSMEMRNQARAEFLVAEFMRARMGAVVLDVERNGEMHKQIYVIR